MPVIYLLTNILEPLFLYTVVFLITRYVFLENVISGKVGRIYHIVTALLLIAAKAVFPSTYTLFISIFIGIDIFVAHKGSFFNKLFAALLTVPIAGIQNGLVNAPIAFTMLATGSDDEITLVTFIVFVSVIIISLLVYFLNKERIRKLIVDTENRSLQRWERLLLCFVGFLLLFDPISFIQLVSLNKDLEFTIELGLIIVLYSIGQFVMTVTVIILVLVGNKQNFYHNKVSRMQFNIILMMAEIVESRDKNTGGHIKRTAKYVEIIANRLKKNNKFKNVLTDAYISDMCVAAPLHDIGKIHVSDSILNKEGPLDDDEFRVMKTHAPEGRELLKNATKHLGEFDYLNIATDMAGYHHEWWDGSSKGYPDRIKGEDIPLSARIMAVADVFDALTSKRCYKAAMPIEKAYSIIKAERGTHFDPDVVDAFFEASTEIEIALKAFNNE